VAFAAGEKRFGIKKKKNTPVRTASLTTPTLQLPLVAKQAQ
jgi:hypothetical protein